MNTCAVRKYYFSISSKSLLRSAGDIKPEEMTRCVRGVSVNEETEVKAIIAQIVTQT